MLTLPNQFQIYERQIFFADTTKPLRLPKLCLRHSRKDILALTDSASPLGFLNPVQN